MVVVSMREYSVSVLPIFSSGFERSVLPSVVLFGNKTPQEEKSS
jgi:hypothetical protein